MSSIDKILKQSKKNFENKNKIPAVELKNLLIDFGGLTAVNNVNLKIYKGELITLLGPSGCGKTTMLNAIAGLLTPTSGKILFKGKDVTKLPPQKRKLGLVFQNYALYPHMNVYKNIAFPLMNDSLWKAGLTKKNDIANLKIQLIILKANGASKSELKQLEKSFFDIYDVKRQSELFLNKKESNGLEDFNIKHAQYNLLKPRYLSAKKDINKWALNQLKKISSRAAKVSLNKELKAKLAKVKNKYIAEKKAAQKELNNSKLNLKNTSFKSKINEIKKTNKIALKTAEESFKNNINDLKSKYTLDKSKLSANQNKQVNEIRKTIISMKQAVHNAVMNVAEKVDIVKNLQKLPTKLSGGQQQRVAIARGIVKNPDILLMDEPLSNLDAKLRIQTRNWIRRIQQELGITLIFVTHDQEEAMAISDKVICLNGGDIQQAGEPLELYSKPANEFVAKFLGMPEMKIFKADVSKTGIVKILGKKITKIDPKINSVNLGLRSDDFQEKGSKSLIAGYIKEIEYLGKEIRAVIDLDHLGETSVSLTRKKDYKIGEKINLDISPKDLNIFNKKTGARINV